MSSPDERVAAQVQRMAALAWAAGVVDSKARFVAIPRKGANGTLYTPRIRIRVALSREDLVQQVYVVLGGSCAPMKGKAVKVWEWSISGAQGCLDALEELSPYLRSKSRASQVMRDLCRRIVDYEPASFDERSIPAAECHERRVLAQTLAGVDAALRR